MEAGALAGRYLSVGTVVLLWGLATLRPPLGPSDPLWQRGEAVQEWGRVEWSKGRRVTWTLLGGRLGSWACGHRLAVGCFDVRMFGWPWENCEVILLFLWCFPKGPMTSLHLALLPPRYPKIIKHLHLPLNRVGFECSGFVLLSQMGGKWLPPNLI